MCFGKNGRGRSHGTRRVTVFSVPSACGHDVDELATHRLLLMDSYDLVKLIALGFFAYSIWILLFKKSERPSLRSVAIVVLGDIGRSPRMMYHAESFANHNFETFLVGYGGLTHNATEFSVV